MKTLFFALLLPLLAFAAPPAKKKVRVERELPPLRFIEVKSFREQPALPPELVLTFDVDCGEEFLHVIREEIVDKETGIVRIAVGGIVRENLQTPCVGTKREKTVAAGTTYSGREYLVEKIQKSAMPLIGPKSAKR